MPYKWTERQFNFDFPAGLLPNILERLASTGSRMKTMTEGLGEDESTMKPEGKWSIKEQIGHLIDLEALHEGRIDDFLERKETLRAADMSNVKTEKAQHNERSLEELIEEFSRERHRFICRLRDLDPETWQFSSMHPRLNKMMRPVDVAYFTAEHDDHHLVCIREILQGLGKSKF